MKTNQYRITFENPSWFFGERFGSILVSAPNEDYAVIQYYNMRGKKISHDVRFVSIEKIS